MKILSVIVGLFLLGIITYTGYFTVAHPNFVVWFGVITAIIAPLGFEFLLYPFKSKDSQLIKQLAKIPQIENLIAEAQSNEAKVKLLEQQKLDLDKMISYESKRRMMLAEKENYILQAEFALKRLDKINVDLEQLTKEKHELPDSLLPLITQLEKVDSKDIVYNLNGRKYAIKKTTFESFPIYGTLLFELIRTFQIMVEKLENQKRN